MYARHAADPYQRSDVGLGFITEAISIGIGVGQQVFGGDGDTMSSGDYYPAVKRGIMLCPGPYDIGAVARALDRNPGLIPEVDEVLRLDRAWTDRSLYGPLSSLSNRQKASALVNWAHGGRDCVAKPAETGAAASSSVIQKALSAVGSSPTAPQPPDVATDWQPTSWSGGLPVPPSTGGSLATATSGAPALTGQAALIGLGALAVALFFSTRGAT